MKANVCFKNATIYLSRVIPTLRFGVALAFCTIFTNDAVSQTSSYNLSLSKNEAFNSSLQSDVSNQPITQSVSKAQPSASEIWANLLFGSSVSKKVAKPQFAFSQGVSSPNSFKFHSPKEESDRRNFNHPNMHPSVDNLNHRNSTGPQVQNSTPNLNVASAITSAPQTLNSRIAELDKYLKTHRPQTKRSNNQLVDLQNLDAKEKECLNTNIDEFNLSRNSQERNYSAIRQTSVTTSSNQRQKIQLANHESPKTSSTQTPSDPFPKRNAQNAPHDTISKLPIRPDALQVSAKSFISTELVRLPQPGSLSSSENTAESARQSRIFSEAHQTPKRPVNVGAPIQAAPTFAKPQTLSSSNQNISEPIRRLPITNNTTSKRTGQHQVLRSSAQFINPQEL